jgi:hypothetical protein
MSNGNATGSGVTLHVVSSLDGFTVIQASWFTEVWLSPVLGLGCARGEARIYGPETKSISRVSHRDVAAFCAIALRHPAAERKTIEFGGSEALSPLDVVGCFDRIGGKAFRWEHISEQMLLAQFEGATDPLQKSFAGLMVRYLHGDAIDMTSVVDTFGIKLSKVDEYARKALANAASA